MKSLLFMVSGALQYRYGEVSISIDMLGGLNKHMPLTTASFVVAALSMIGIPPTGGFFSKWYLLLASLEKGQFLFIAVIVASSLLNAVYFFRVIENIFISKDAELTSLQKEERLEIPFSMLMPIVLFGIAILAVGLFNSYFVEEIIRLGLPEVLAV
jgi:NADH-quinone oxidoreductase subunit N